mgnify:FL=1
MEAKQENEVLLFSQSQLAVSTCNTMMDWMILALFFFFWCWLFLIDVVGVFFVVVDFSLRCATLLRSRCCFCVHQLASSRSVVLKTLARVLEWSLEKWRRVSIEVVRLELGAKAKLTLYRVSRRNSNADADAKSKALNKGSSRTRWNTLYDFINKNSFL